MESFNCLYRVLQSISFHSIVITSCLSGKKKPIKDLYRKKFGRINYNFNQVQENLLLFNTRVPDFFFEESQSTVGSVADLRTRGRWFDPRLGRYSFRGMMIVIATEFIPLSPLSVVSTMVTWESSQWLGKNIVRSTDEKNSRKALISALAAVISAKYCWTMALNTIQSINNMTLL